MLLIPTHCTKKGKLLCTEIHNRTPCHRKETFICSNLSCSVCASRQCHESYPKEHVIFLATSCVVSDNCTFGIPNDHGDQHKEDEGRNVCDANDKEESSNDDANDNEEFLIPSIRL